MSSLIMRPNYKAGDAEFDDDVRLLNAGTPQIILWSENRLNLDSLRPILALCVAAQRQAAYWRHEAMTRYVPDKGDKDILTEQAKNQWRENGNTGYGYAFIDPDCGGYASGWHKEWGQAYTRIPSKSLAWVMYGDGNINEPMFNTSWDFHLLDKETDHVQRG